MWELLFCSGPIEYPHLIRIGSPQIWDFAMVWPQMERRPSQIRGGQGCSGLIVCEIPIGRDDTRRVAVCVLYRNGLYRRKIDEKGVEKYAKTRGK